MASGINYEDLLKQMVENDCILEESEDQFTTYQSLLALEITKYEEKTKRLEELKSKKSVMTDVLNTHIGVIQSLQTQRLELDELLQHVCDKITGIEKKFEAMVKKNASEIDELRNKISTIETEFDADKLKQQIAELKMEEQDAKNEIVTLLEEKKVVLKSLNKLNEELPDFDALIKVKNSVFSEENKMELVKKEKELANIKAFINDLKLKLKEISK